MPPERMHRALCQAAQYLAQCQMQGIRPGSPCEQQSMHPIFRLA